MTERDHNMRTSSTPTSIKLDEKLKNRIQSLAEVKHRSIHWMMREAIEEYVSREEARESFKQEALASWKNFQETGLHVTHQELCDWLDTWGTENEIEAPEQQFPLFSDFRDQCNE